MGLPNGGYSCTDCDDCEECTLLDPTPSRWGVAWTVADLAFNLSRSITGFLANVRIDLRVKHNLTVGAEEFSSSVAATIADL